jgi:hypothetical protein
MSHEDITVSTRPIASCDGSLPTAGGSAAVGQIEASVLTGPDVAYLLHHHLGPMREWSDFLSDCRRNDRRSRTASLHGQVLTPVLVLVDGKHERPLYLVSQLREFISTIKRMGLGVHQCRDRIRPIKAVVDLTKRDWRDRRVSPAGRPLAQSATRLMMTASYGVRA